MLRSPSRASWLWRLDLGCIVTEDLPSEWLLENLLLRLRQAKELHSLRTRTSEARAALRGSPRRPRREASVCRYLISTTASMSLGSKLELALNRYMQQYGIDVPVCDHLGLEHVNEGR